MTDHDLRKLLSAATPGPWSWCSEDGEWFLSPGILAVESGMTDGTPDGDTIDYANAALIAAAPDLAAEVLRLRDGLAEMTRRRDEWRKAAETKLPEVVAMIAERAALRAEVERLLPWAKLGRAVMDGWPDYGDLDGGQLQDLAEKAGVLVPVEGGYNPEIHGDADYNGAEPGDEWFMMIPAPAALGDKDASHD